MLKKLSPLLLSLLFCVGLTAPLFSQEEQVTRALRRIEAHLLLKDENSALIEVKEALSRDPQNREIFQKWVAILARAGQEDEMMRAWELFPKESQDKGSQGNENQDQAYAHPLLEEMAWGILKKGAHSSSLSIRTVTLLGATLTQDARAVPLLLEAMSDPNASLRALGIECASLYGDELLRDKIRALFLGEKNPQVRLSLMGAISKLKLDELLPSLVERVGSSKSSSEEKVEAIQAILSLKESLDLKELTALATSPRFYLRMLAGECIGHYQLTSLAHLLPPLLTDARAEVRLAAIKAIGMLRLERIQGVYFPHLLVSAAESSDSLVNISAGWALLLLKPLEGKKILKSYLNHAQHEVRILAAAAIASAGPYGIEIAREEIVLQRDPFVRANLALALIGQRQESALCCQVVQELCALPDLKLMWGSKVGDLFRPLQKSKIKHTSELPNFPEVSDQLVRLELLSLLITLGDQKASAAMEHFLSSCHWSITGVAAQTLLGQGDEAAIETIRALFQRSRAEVRVDAALALGVWGCDRSVLPYLLETYSQSDRALQIKILETLGRIGDRSVIPFLVEQFHQPSQQLRIIAAAILLQILHS